MKITNRNVCGIQVEKEKIIACIIAGNKKEKQEFQINAADVLALYDWILSNRCTRIAIEGTEYEWKSLYYLLAFDSRLSVTVVDFKKRTYVSSKKKHAMRAEKLAVMLKNGKFTRKRIRRHTIMQSNNRKAI